MRSFLDSTSFLGQESPIQSSYSFFSCSSSHSAYFCRESKRSLLFSSKKSWGVARVSRFSRATPFASTAPDQDAASFREKEPTGTKWKLHLPLKFLSFLFGRGNRMKDFETWNLEESDADFQKVFMNSFSRPGFMRPVTEDVSKRIMLRNVGRIRSIRPCSISEDILLVTVERETVNASQNWMHERPGQFVQISGKPSHASCSSMAVIASAPFFVDNSNVIELVISKQSDPCKLSKKIGEQVFLSPIMGHGLDYVYPSKSERLYVFVDCPQGMAAVRSFLKWHLFRAMSGTGTYRTTQVTVFYEAPNSTFMAFLSDFRDWNVFGVEVVPVLDCSLKDFVPSYLNSKSFHSLTVSSIFAVASDRTANFLQSLLLCHGVKLSFMQSLTQERLEREFTEFKKLDHFQEAEDSYLEMEREMFEEKMWNTWKQQREGMWSEFVERRHMRETSRPSASDEKELWDDWFSRNSESWKDSIWDEHMWQQYWSTWKDERESWFHSGSFNTRDFGGPGSYSKTGYGYHDPSYASGWDTESFSANSSYSDDSSSIGSFSSDSYFDPYAILEISNGASISEVKRAYRQQALRWHPDLNKDNLELSKRRMQQVILAYQIVKEEYRHRCR
ncbi:hypothetical protein Gasu2_26340 [Galdieria sulphuraria]|uniref:DnaJ domain-containing protein n=1 Tax=Galdieria sulphuraria TaxID=130081 RepID=M2W004_GALSU|nr:DnaJ domain-containing protein [Galdieria sulphuraria]EME28936.1 DnaJ domain-containing protein [Galdieria sulphuraria]GJD08325.1 hypothetical protein Gasu2_26340 [Galdieria sulphuraria]|eukprot:XP_005705456.1 DnaJ domain-containing protein [Galdieria sulphuraria]